MVQAPPQPKLTLLQERFIDHYLISGNASDAYIKAGYASSTDLAIRVNASRLLSTDNIQQAISKRKAELAQSHQLTASDVMAGLAKEARSGDTSASRVAAWRTLADILGMTSGRAGDLPSALPALLEAVKAGYSLAQRPAISAGPVIEIEASPDESA